MKVYQRMIITAASLLLALPASAEVVTAMIRLQEKVPLEQLADSVRSPESVRYGQFYTPEEIQSLVAPPPEEYQGLIGQLQNEGFKVTKEAKTHLWLTVEGDSSLFEKVFQTKFQYNAAKQRKVLYEARVPVYMSLVASVGGLNTTRKSFPKYRLAEKVQSLDSAAPTASIPGISAATIKTVYGFDGIYSSGISATGQHIAIATYDDFNIDDVNYFYQALNLSPIPTVDKVPFNGTPTLNNDSAVETQLDAEFSGMIGTGASIHVFSSASNSDTGELQLFTAILDDNRSKVVNYSWGGCETQLTPQHAQDMDKVFAQAVAQGVNIMIASGDSGSDSCQDGTTAADWPAANPNVVAVGGTTLSVSGTHGTEQGWSGSGGGISALFTLPAWQNAIGAAYTKRSYPDVAFNADPMSAQAVYAHNNGTAQWIPIGGTSMAAPQWSGFMALVGGARAAKGKATLGYLNPLIYGLNASDNDAAFTDITSGSNGVYSAARGWDAVTGLGSMKAQALLNILSQ